jgi:tetratricopeptide (TPR) repeat protein
MLLLVVLVGVVCANFLEDLNGGLIKMKTKNVIFSVLGGVVLVVLFYFFAPISIWNRSYVFCLLSGGWKAVESPEVVRTISSDDAFSDLNSIKKNAIERLASNPKNPIYLYQLGLCLLHGEKGEKLKGLKLLKEVSENKDVDPAIILHIMEVFTRECENEELCDEGYVLKKMVEILPSFPKSSMDKVGVARMYIKAGVIFEILGDIENAKKCYEEAIRRQPTDVCLLSDKEFYIKPGIHEEYKRYLSELKKGVKHSLN